MRNDDPVGHVECMTPASGPLTIQKFANPVVIFSACPVLVSAACRRGNIKMIPAAVAEVPDWCNKLYIWAGCIKGVVPSPIGQSWRVLHYRLSTCSTITLYTTEPGEPVVPSRATPQSALNPIVIKSFQINKTNKSNLRTRMWHMKTLKFDIKLI